MKNVKCVKLDLCFTDQMSKLQVILSRLTSVKLLNEILKFNFLHYINGLTLEGQTINRWK